ncbi:MAG: ArsR family transcriptional regulator [Candidatus Woesearchaeota archaeon]
MQVHYQRITIIKTGRSPTNTINDELQWFGGSLGLFSLRDKDKSCFRIFITLLQYAKQQQAITSDELAAQLGLTRGTVVHHLNKLMESGIVVHRANHYALRTTNLTELVEEIERDAKRMVADLKKVAGTIDKALNLPKSE